MNSAVQSHIDLYVSQQTYAEVTRAFPYLGRPALLAKFVELTNPVSKEFASGGGDVPEFKWHIIDDGVPFEVGNTGVRVLPFAGEHTMNSVMNCAHESV